MSWRGEQHYVQISSDFLVVLAKLSLGAMVGKVSVISDMICKTPPYHYSPYALFTEGDPFKGLRASTWEKF